MHHFSTKHLIRGLAGMTLLCIATAFGKPGRSADPSPEAILSSYPKDYFVNPVDDAIRLTGTFGELRPDHFHSGIDIKSKTGGIGQPIFAAASGFVSRIKVQASGYGNVMYIDHPNGYTTVYAHLDRFAPELERYVRENQYKKEQFEIELQPAEGTFKVQQGEVIGRMGNSGSSSGPHLHFEIRNSKTGKGLNPLLFGLPVPDREPPQLRDLKVYFLSEKRETLGSKGIELICKADGTYGVVGDTLQLGAWRTGFALKSIDQMTGFRNNNGIYAITMLVDGQTAYEWRMDELDFDETRYMNAHVDYQALKRGNGWFQRCFVLPGDKLSNYTRTEGLGVVPLYKEKASKINIKVMDTAGNATNLQFWAKRSENMESFVSQPYQYEFAHDNDTRLELEDLQLSIGKGTLYETLFFQYRTTPDESTGIYSSVHHLHHEKTPVHRHFDLALRPRNLPDALRDKAVVARCDGGKPENCGGTWKGDFLTTRVRRFGDYCVMVDEQPPKITPISFLPDMRRRNVLSFRISDNFAVSGMANGLSYRGTIDGQWVLFEYDKKRALLSYAFDGRVTAGDHALRLSVKDDRGNEATFERNFKR